MKIKHTAMLFLQFLFSVGIVWGGISILDDKININRINEEFKRDCILRNLPCGDPWLITHKQTFDK